MNVKKGIIAGIAAGITYIISSTLTAFVLGMILMFAFGLQPHQTHLPFYKPIVLKPTLTWIITLNLGYIILAIPCGLIYSVLHKAIPGRNAVIKGLYGGLVVWYFLAVMNGFWRYMAIAIPNITLATEILVDLVGLTAAGVVLGIVYDKV